MDNDQAGKEGSSQLAENTLNREDIFAEMRVDERFDACNDPVYEPVPDH